ncbi:hypothetical protein [Brevibacterium siliguriense]|uniref:hypothetical protein n=1 Tax=Brevibacterium siliguriense TaxID=1136497 RepID=UPI001E28963A|nr:hypothetical protein [Brevibacterium siliguriense]
MSLDAPVTRPHGADSGPPTQDHSAPVSTTDERPSTGWLEAIVVFAAMALTAVAVSAVFKDFAWLPPVMVSVAVVVIIGAVFRTIPALRSTGTAVIAQCVVGIIAVFVVCAGDSLVLGFIPTGESFGTVIDLLSEGVSDLYATAPRQRAHRASSRCSRSPSPSSRSSSTVSSRICGRRRSAACCCSCCG